MLNSRMFSGLSQIPSLGSFLLRGHVLPEKRYAERAISAFKRAFEGFDIVHVGRHHLGSEFGKRFGFLGINVSGQSTRSELSIWIGKDGANQTPTLTSCCTYYCNDFLGHKASSDVKSSTP